MRGVRTPLDVLPATTDDRARVRISIDHFLRMTKEGPRWFIAEPVIDDRWASAADDPTRTITHAARRQGRSFPRGAAESIRLHPRKVRMTSNSCGSHDVRALRVIKGPRRQPGHLPLGRSAALPWHSTTVGSRRRSLARLALSYVKPLSPTRNFPRTPARRSRQMKLSGRHRRSGCIKLSCSADAVRLTILLELADVSRMPIRPGRTGSVTPLAGGCRRAARC